MGYTGATSVLILDMIVWGRVTRICGDSSFRHLGPGFQIGAGVFRGGEEGQVERTQ